MTTRKFIGLFQLGILDLAMGAFIAHVLSLAFLGDHGSLPIYLTGAALGALPDVDLVKPLLSKNTLNLTHRNTVFHQPLLFLVIPAVVLFFISAFWAWLWALPLLWHYLHDTVGEFMGIQWLFPFSRKKFSLWDVNKAGRRKLLTTHPENFPGLSLDQALNKKFYSLTPTSVIEAVLPLILLTFIVLTW